MNVTNIRPFVLLAVIPLALLSGCVVAPPDADYANGISVAGASEPIAFVSDEMPTDCSFEDGSPMLTLSDALSRALKSDPSIQAAIADVRVALADARQARLFPNPVLSVAVRFPEGGGNAVIEAGLAADLISLLTRPRQINAADHHLRGERPRADGTALDRIAEVQERYAAVQASDARLDVLDQRQKLIGQLLNLAKAKLEAGESSRLDVIALDGERVSLLVEETETSSERRAQRLMLARLIGQPSGRTDWELTPWSSPNPVTGDEQSWVRVALEHRPEIQARRWELAALGDEAALAGFAAFDGADVGVDAERDDDWSVGPAISAPLPLFDWGQQRRARAEAQRIAARHRLTDTRRQVIEDVRRAVESLTASQAALRQMNAELIPLADQRVQHAEAAYKNGSAEVTAVLLAQQGAQAARSKLIELQQKTSSALYRLHRAVGGSVHAAEVTTTAASTAPTTQEEESTP